MAEEQKIMDEPVEPGKGNASPGVVMNTVFQQIREEGIEIGVKEGIEIGVKEGIEIGVKEGMKEGKEDKSLQVALKCLQKGMDIETVAEITDLPIERIKGLKFALQQEHSAYL